MTYKIEFVSKSSGNKGTYPSSSDTIVPININTSSVNLVSEELYICNWYSENKAGVKDTVYLSLDFNREVRSNTMDSSYCPLKVDFTIKYNSDGTQRVVDQDNIVYTSSDSKKWLVYLQ